MMSSPLNVPFRPRNVFSPKSCCAASNLYVEDVVGPAGEGARGLADVVLGVVPHAHREQLEQLAAEVLVGMRLDVLAVVEKDEHRRILEDPDQQIRQPARRVGAQHQILLQHHPVVADLVLSGREVPVPEQRQLLFERTRRREHAVRPPQAEPLRFDLVRVEAVEELVDDRLESPLRTDRQHLLTESLASLAS